VRVAVLSGGVGGARFVQGLLDAVEPSGVGVSANGGDDLEVYGLHVSPDVDTLLYTLGGEADLERGWGRKGETWRARESATELGAETWFQLGDRDLGLHLARREALDRGEPLSAITERFAGAFGIDARILPATDDRLRTWIRTGDGELSFQEWFVLHRHEPEVHAVRFEGAETATAAPGVLEALAQADLIAIGPSNPFVSVGPILAVEEIRKAIRNRRIPAVAISPLIGGKAVKGPADRMLGNLAGGTGPEHVASCYAGLIDALVYDESDRDAVLPDGVRPIVTSTLMTDAASRRRVAEAALEAAAALR
jgi:LPPG:FO 2-phospho-L-lactate transferase